MNALTYYGELVDWILSHVTDADMFLVQSAVTCCALFWLLHRAWLTLWKPVPELISILGVEVPDAPEVSLAGIKSEAVTLHWTRPSANKPVVKYLIQVNGVNVGDSSRTEVAITVTGLKPAHFYNVRVIAVGSNNFQAGSRVIRLRTYGRDGRPQLGHGRVPSNFAVEEHPIGSLVDSSDESPAVRSHGIGIESALTHDGSQGVSREPSTGNNSNRRNTVGRKHSPSVAAADQAALAKKTASDEPEVSMQQLADRFESIRKETEEIMSQVAKDAEEFRSQVDDLAREKDEKRQVLKEKEEASEKLIKEVNMADRANRQAQNRRAQKEKTLRDKQAERAKMDDDLVKWQREIDAMKEERAVWQKEKAKLLADKEARITGLRKTLKQRQNSLNSLEEEFRVLGILKDEQKRQLPPGAQDDEELREREERQLDFQWECRERELTSQLHIHTRDLRDMEVRFQQAQAAFGGMQAQRQINPLMYHGNSSGVDFDPVPQGKVKSRRSRNRKSRTNTISSPVSGYPITDSPFPNASTYNNLNVVPSPTFAPGPYYDLSADTAMVPISDQTVGISETELRALTAGAPLSPTATSLLPSNIFADDEPPSPRQGSARSFGPALHPHASPSPYDREHDPQSPASSSRSASLISSPQSSSQNLPMFGISGHGYGIEPDRRSLNSTMGNFGVVGSPGRADHRHPQRGLSNLFGFPRSRGKTLQEDSLEGPALGTLKLGQSQSFPRSTDDPEVASRHRRISFSSGWNVMPSFLTRASAPPATTEGIETTLVQNDNPRARRGFNMFGSSIDSTAGLVSRDPGSPRPVSIASSDLPRPSSESAPFGWPAVEGIQLNRNSPLATNWSISLLPTWSRNPSRRPSLQHGGSAAPPSGLISDDDEFLPSETLAGQSSPPPVGVIGTRPASSHKPITPKLNPAAATFKVKLSRLGKTDKDKDKEKDKDKDKGKNKEKQMEKLLPPDDPFPLPMSTSPIERRHSRDTHSIHTQDSIADSHESLERSSSNTPSELAAVFSTSSKSQESSFRQLLKKSSSSKFSFSSIRGKDSGSLFGNKKGGSSVTNSDRKGSLDEFREDAEPGQSGADSFTASSSTHSPQIGAMGSASVNDGGSGSGKNKEPREPGSAKEGRMSVNWGRFSIKKQKGRESLDVDRSEAEMTGTEDEGGAE